MKVHARDGRVGGCATWCLGKEVVRGQPEWTVV